MFENTFLEYPRGAQQRLELSAYRNGGHSELREDTEEWEAFLGLTQGRCWRSETAPKPLSSGRHGVSRSRALPFQPSTEERSSKKSQNTLQRTWAACVLTRALGKPPHSDADGFRHDSQLPALPYVEPDCPRGCWALPEM